MVTIRKTHKSPNLCLGQIDLIWQEFESITSPTFEILKLLVYLQEIRVYLAHLDSVLDDFSL
jgi:hypothetical protein